MLTKIQTICEKNQTQIFYLKGNHERINHENNPEVQTRLIASPRMKITSNNKTYLIIHGDSFEKELSKPNLFAIGFFFIDTFFGRLDQKLHTNYAISHFLKNIYAFLTNQKNRFIRHAIVYAKKNKVDGIICGHMHQPEMQTIDGIDYFNCGDRTESCSALVEDSKGKRELLYT